MEKFVVVRLGSQNLLRIRGTWESATSRLSRYSIGTALDVIGRISILVNRRDVSQAELDVMVLAGLLGHKSPAIRNLAKWRKKHPYEPVAVFNELQLVTAAKLALLVCDSAPQGEPDSRKELCQALLVINEHLDPPLGDLSTTEGQQALQMYFLANGLFNYGDAPVPDLVRTWDIYLRDHPELQSDQHYLDLPAQLQAITGLSSDDLLGVLFALNAHWRAYDLSNPGTTPSILVPDYLTRHFSYSPSELDSVDRLVSAPLSEMKSEVARRYANDIKPYDILPLARSPLIKFEGGYYCPSAKLIWEKLTRGVHHIFLDPTVGESDRRRFLDYIGVVFERYINALLTRCYGDRVIEEGRYRDRVAGKTCDGVIRVGEALLCYEAKATLFSLPIVTGESYTDFKTITDRVLVRSARQISNVIDAVQDGMFSDLGIRAEDVKQFVPITVTLERMPLHKVVYEGIRTRLQAEGVLWQDSVIPWQVLDVGEIESFETAMAAGLAPHETLIQKARNAGTVWESFRNYILTREPQWPDGYSPYIEVVWNELSQRLEDHFAQRNR
jgi:hypothetical protein